MDRLLGEHGIGADTAQGRAEFERRMEVRRQAERDDTQWEPMRRGWCLGSEAFRKELLQRMEGQLGEHQAGELKRETTLTVGWIAQRLAMGTRQSVTIRLLEMKCKSQNQKARKDNVIV